MLADTTTNAKNTTTNTKHYMKKHAHWKQAAHYARRRQTLA